MHRHARATGLPLAAAALAPIRPSEPAAVWSGAYVGFGDAVFVFIDPPTLRKLSKLVS